MTKRIQDFKCCVLFFHEMPVCLRTYRDEQVRRLLTKYCAPIIALLLCANTPLISQVLSFRNYTVKDGLAGNTILSISQDSQGDLWIGTADGLSEFDGQKFTNYSVVNGLPANFVYGIIADRTIPGKIWFLSDKRVCSFADGHFKTFTLNARIANILYQDHGGVVWCGTEHGIERIEKDSVTEFSPGKFHDDVEAITMVGDSLLWFTMDSSLFSYSLTTRESQRIRLKGYGTGRVHILDSDNYGNVWAVMGGNVVLKIGRGRSIQSKAMSFAVSFLEIDRSDSMAWIGHSDGIGKFNIQRFPDVEVSRFRIQTDSLENEIKSSFIDREGNLWVGYLSRGISRLMNEKRVVFPIKVDSHDSDHQYAASDSHGHIWVLASGNLTEFWVDKTHTWRSYLHKFSSGKLTGLPNGGYLRNGIVNSFSFDEDGHLLVSRVDNQFSLTCYEVSLLPSASSEGEPGRSQLKSLFNVPFPWLIHSVVVDKSKQLWIHLWGPKGMAVIDVHRRNKVLRWFSDKDGFPTNYVRDVFQDSHGNIWGTTFSDGVVELAAGDFANGKFRNITLRDGLPGLSTFSILEDRRGNILVGALNKGLVIIRGDSIRTISMKEGLPSNNILSMTVDRFGRLWLGTSIGMICETAPGSLTFVKAQSFLGTAAGASGITTDGLLWWVTPDDLSIYDYGSDPNISLPPPIHIRAVKVNGEQQDMMMDMELPHDKNNVEIEFIGINLKDPEAVRYTYRLLGNEVTWNAPTRNTAITYGNLAPGNYTFELKAISGDGIESDFPARVSIAILRPYWKQWWFYSSAGVILLSVIYGGYRRRVAGFLREQQLNQRFTRRLIASQEDERKRVARELHDDLGQELIVISHRARMGFKSATEGESRNQFDLITNTASRALESVREIAYNLSPYHLDQIGLSGALKGMVARISELAGVKFTLDIDEFDPRLSKEFEIHLYRIAQECVNNIAKHSMATAGAISMKLRAHTIEMAITDNGKGFDVSAYTGKSARRQGFGLHGLKERVHVLAGTMSIESTPGRGTTMLFSIPQKSEGNAAEERRDESENGA